jgi:hypothetical protein
MRHVFRTVFVLAVLFAPFAIGCSSQQSVEDTPITASDNDNAAAPVNDADNP